MSTDNNDNNMSSCANCGKGEEDSITLKTCTACKMVKYCSADCQKAHRPQHKKECKLRAAELHEEALFKQPPINEDCPICFLRLPTLSKGKTYMSCCGKSICSGCIHAVKAMNSVAKCPFCRTAAPYSNEEIIKQFMKRVEMGDPRAMYSLGCYYSNGYFGLPQDSAKALELWHRAAELGNTEAYCNIGTAYDSGRGAERDKKKAIYYWELAAMGGNVIARYNLGLSEANKSNYNRAIKHFMIAVGCGGADSLEEIKHLYKTGRATKDDYAKALRAYQAYLCEIKSDQRDEAAFREEFKYYEL